MLKNRRKNEDAEKQWCATPVFAASNLPAASTVSKTVVEARSSPHFPLSALSWNQEGTLYGITSSENQTAH
jgi:hypothetical protein